MDELCIQIVNYKTKKYLIEYLRTLQGDTEDLNISYKVLIADSNSGDDLSDIPKMFPLLPIETYQLKDNRGYGAAHNTLAELCSSKYILMSNPDILYCEKKTVARLLDCIKNYKSQALGCMLLSDNGEVQFWDHGELKGIWTRVMIWLGSTHWKKRTNPARVAWANGAHLLIDRKWFDKMHGFDENYFLYKEEEDLCLRIRKNGGTIYYDPSIKVRHRGSVVASKGKYLAKSFEYYVQKHYRNKPQYLLIRLFLMLQLFFSKYVSRYFQS